MDDDTGSTNDLTTGRSQTAYATEIEANWYKFSWNSFPTESTACQVIKYEIFGQIGGSQIPIETKVVNSYDENPIQGTTNANRFLFGLVDGAKAA